MGSSQIIQCCQLPSAPNITVEHILLHKLSWPMWLLLICIPSHRTPPHQKKKKKQSCKWRKGILWIRMIFQFLLLRVGRAPSMLLSSGVVLNLQASSQKPGPPLPSRYCPYIPSLDFPKSIIPIPFLPLCLLCPLLFSFPLYFQPLTSDITKWCERLEI